MISPPAYYSPYLQKFEGTIDGILNRLPSEGEPIMNVVNALNDILLGEMPQRPLFPLSADRISSLTVLFHDPIMLKKKHYSSLENAAYAPPFPALEDFKQIAQVRIHAKISDLMKRHSQAMQNDPYLATLSCEISDLKGLVEGIGTQIDKDNEKLKLLRKRY